MNVSFHAWSLLNVQAIELIEYDFPGRVRVRLVDAHGVPRTFEDKIPIFFHGDEPTPTMTFPVPAHIRCQVLRAEIAADGGEVLVVSTGVDDVQDQDGLEEFHVLRDQVAQPPAHSAGS